MPRRLVGVVPLAAVALVLLAVGPSVTAQDGAVTFERSPASGPPGTVIAVSGTGCLLGGEPADFAFVLAFNLLGSPNPPFDFSARLPVEADGSFSGELTVPLDALPEEYRLGGHCALQDQAFGSFDAPFTVTGTGPTTSTSSTSTSTTSLLVVDPVIDPPPVAPPADPMPGTPRYTG